MKKVYWIFSLLFLFNSLGIGQNNYFQQEVNYKIEVTLDDQEHELIGNIEMTYINNAPKSLKEIYLHLWPNAYLNRKTAFAKQKIRQGDTEFYFSDKRQRGGFSNLNFTVDGKNLEIEYDPKNPDIGLLKLNNPLASGGTIIIKTPFTLKIPDSFSRLGHVGESYQLTQWYPKPAVYDQEGWHQMPYLDMGEFYSEFGSFDVKITLPENYVVGATGVLQTKSELEFLEQHVKESNAKLGALDLKKNLARDTFPTSSAEMKTLHYQAERVHDFAWFADKRFMVQRSAVQLTSGKTIDTWAYFTQTEVGLWKDEAIKYLDRSVKFYSDLVGEYPYPHATAVQSALSAGGGMEYPMITVIGLSGTAQALDEVITHEVGHNWFYGILASNERDHPWMDEGLNSYYDHRYSNQYYPTDRFTNRSGGNFFFKGSPIDLLELGYLHQARRKEDQAPDTHSDEFKKINYWLGAYEKPAVAFRWLEKYLGTEKFDIAMRGFYDTWKFRHPQPEDLQNYLETATGKKLDWLFENLIYGTDQQDYAIRDIEKKRDGYRLTVENKGEMSGPFSISGIKNGEIKTTMFKEGFKKNKKINFEGTDYDKIVIDAEGITTDINRRNNTIKTSGSFKKIEPIQFKFLTGVENPNRSILYYSPTIGYNNYDGALIGLALYNISVPTKPFEFAFLPSYAFMSNEIVGLGELAYRFYPASNFVKGVQLKLGIKQFNSFFNEEDDYFIQFRKITPSITLDLNSTPNKRFYHYLKFRTIILSEEFANFALDPIASEIVYTGNTTDTRPIFELSYEAVNNRGINPYRFRVALEQQSYERFTDDESYVKASLEYITKYTYKENRNITFRFFLGGFLQNTIRNRSVNRTTEGAFALNSEGFNDYKFDEFFFGRSEADGFFSQQISLNDGGMKLPIGASQAGNLGKSNNYIIALNIKGDLPQRLPLGLPIKPYFDLGYFDNSGPLGSDDSFSDQLVFSGGLMLDFLDGTIGVYFPFLNSNNAKDLLEQNGGYGNRISFNINFNRLNPTVIRDRIEF